MWNNDWKKGEDYPTWGDTDVYKKITLIEENTPRLFELVKSLETYLTKPEEKNNEKEEEKDPWD